VLEDEEGPDKQFKFKLPQTTMKDRNKTPHAKPISVPERRKDVRPDTISIENQSPMSNSPKTNSKRSSSAPYQMYRIQGIPAGLSKDEAKEFLRRKLDLEETTNISFKSLATSKTRNERVAVASFYPKPHCLVLERNQWSFGSSELYDSVDDDTSITIDSHFIGLTILCSPNNAFRKIE
jgi:hypothetical protein